MKNRKIHFTSVSGLWLLNTASASGSLLAASRLAVPTSLPGGFGFYSQATLTPDGTKIIVPAQRSGLASMTFEFEVFSTRTRKPVYALHPVHIRNGSPYPDLSMAWSNPSGSVLVVQAPTGNGRPTVLGVLSGDKFIPIPGAPAVTGGIPQLVF